MMAGVTLLRAGLTVSFVTVSCGLAHTVRPADLDAWRDVPVGELELHPLFSTMPREVRPLSDGGELWIFRNCSSGNAPVNCTHTPASVVTPARTTCNGGEEYSTCCHNQFIVRDKRVVSYRANGDCYTDCTVRPSSKPC